MKFIKLFLLLSNVLSICAGEKILKLYNEHQPKQHSPMPYKKPDSMRMLAIIQPNFNAEEFRFEFDYYGGSQTYAEVASQIIDKYNAKYKKSLDNKFSTILRDYKIIFNGQEISPTFISFSDIMPLGFSIKIIKIS